MEGRMKILFLIPTLGHGGAERVLVNLVNNLDKSKYQVTVQTLFDEGVNKQYLSPEVNYKSFGKHQFRGNCFLLSLLPSTFLYKWIVNDQYDIVISYLEGPTTRILSGCPFPDTKKVYWVHIEMRDKKSLKVGFLRFSQAVAAYSEASRIVFVANSVKDCFNRTVGASFPTEITLYNTNETEQILHKSREQIADVIFSKATVNICSVAKIIHSKGFDRLARVHERLEKEGLTHHIYILGVGSEQEKIENYLREHGVSEGFTFLGYRENPYKYVAACDLYVCSSRREGFSTAVTESLIVGTPVVSTGCSGARELLGEHDEYGIVTDNSEEGIYEGMKKMLQNPGLLRHYAQKAKERGHKFSREETVKAVEDMLDNLFNG